MKVAFAGSFAARMVEPVRALVGVGCEMVVADENGILPLLGDADVLVSISFTREMADAAPRLRLLQVPGAGIDRVDRAALRQAINVANVHGHEVGIAEYVIGAMIALTRAIRRVDERLRRGEWESQWAIGTPAPPPWPELAGKSLAILGFGHIGQALAQRACAFDMTICAIRRQAQSTCPDGVSFIGGPEHLDAVLRQADYLAITLPLTQDTRGLLDDRRLRLMKPTACLINVARAEVVDENSLYRALTTGGLAAAALDVWYRYPTMPGTALPASRPFHELDNVILTPHVSGWTEGMMAARAELIACNIGRVARGEAPRNALHVAP